MEGRCLLPDDTTQYSRTNWHQTADFMYRWRHMTCREIRILKALSSNFCRSERYVWDSGAEAVIHKHRSPHCVRSWCSLWTYRDVSKWCSVTVTCRHNTTRTSQRRKARKEKGKIEIKGISRCPKVDLRTGGRTSNRNACRQLFVACQSRQPHTHAVGLMLLVQESL